MEIIKGNNTTPIRVSLPTTALQITAEFSLNGVSTGLLYEVPVEDGISTFIPPYSAVEKEGLLLCSVTFVESGEFYTKDVYVDVVTPYLDLWEIRDILGTTDVDACWAL